VIRRHFPRAVPSSHSVPNGEDQTLETHTRNTLPVITRRKLKLAHLLFTASRLLQSSAWLLARAEVSSAVKDPAIEVINAELQHVTETEPAACATAEAVTCAAISHSRCFGFVRTRTRTHTKLMHHSLCMHLATPSALPHLTAQYLQKDLIATMMSTCGEGFSSLLQVFSTPCLILASDRSAGQY